MVKGWKNRESPMNIHETEETTENLMEQEH